MSASTSSLKPITLYGAAGPNPPKVAMILEELNLPYTINPIPISDVKTPSYIQINPNGRLPSIHDPNTDLTLWESGAIIEYLIERYDTDHNLSFPARTNEAALTKQWLFFQTSGQGPYYGQAAWFKKFHHEMLPSALARYAGEVKRVCGVVEGWLAKQKEVYAGKGGNGPWLVGNRCTYADIAWIQWQRVIGMILTNEEFDDGEFPLVKAWVAKMMERESIKKVIEGGK